MTRVAQHRASTRSYPIAAALAALIVWLASAVPARAEIVQFARFDLTDGLPFTFSYRNPDATLTASTGVDFYYVNIGGVPLDRQAATLTLTASTTAAASDQGAFSVQPIDQLGTLSIIRDSDHANLLSVSFTGVLAGVRGTNNLTLNAAQANGTIVAFSSDVIPTATLALMVQHSMQLSLQPVTPLLGVDSGTGFLNDFRSNGMGMFVATIVPEPGSLALTSCGVGTCLLVFLRRPRR